MPPRIPLLLTAALAAGATSTAQVVECEGPASARSADARHEMLASSGHYVIATPGRVLRWTTLVEREIVRPVLTWRASAPPDATVTVRVGVASRRRGNVARDRKLEFDGRPQREDFAVASTELAPRIAPGEYEVTLELDGPSGELWVDCFAISTTDDVPAALSAKRRFEPEEGGHFRVLYSPHVAAATLDTHAAFVEKLEYHYAFLSGYLGHEPDPPLLTCGVSAAIDSAGGAAHASGSLFVIDESEVPQAVAGNSVHEMTHCFQNGYPDNGLLPGWIREGEAFFTTCLAAETLYGDAGAALMTAGHFEGIDDHRLRNDSLGRFGYSAIHEFRTHRQDDQERPYYPTWNRIFHALFLLDRDLVRAFHDRLRRAIEGGFAPAADDWQARFEEIEGEYVSLLLGDGPAAWDIARAWSLITWRREAAPDLGERVVRIRCAAKTRKLERDVKWKRAHDDHHLQRGFSYRVLDGMCHRNDPIHQWVADDPRRGHKPLRFEIGTRGGFRGWLRLVPDPGPRLLRIAIDDADAGLLGGGHVIRRVEHPAGQDRLTVELRREAAFNAALREVELYRDVEPGEILLDVRCGAGVGDGQAGQSLGWDASLDRVVARADGFGYRMTDGYCWRDGDDHQWWAHRPAAGQGPMVIEVTTPAGFEGWLTLDLDPRGRRHRVILDRETGFDVGDLGRTVFPLTATETDDGVVVVELRRMSGVNAALMGLSVAAKR